MSDTKPWSVVIWSAQTVSYSIMASYPTRAEAAAVAAKAGDAAKVLFRSIPAPAQRRYRDDDF
jgi:hypothetical protein